MVYRLVIKLNLTTGVFLLSPFPLAFWDSWTKFAEKSGLLTQPFTRQENTVIQTCVVASSGIAFSAEHPYVQWLGYEDDYELRMSLFLFLR